MTDAEQTELGDVQRTLFFPLLARARETDRKHPLLRDPKAAEANQKAAYRRRTEPVTTVALTRAHHVREEAARLAAIIPLPLKRRPNQMNEYSAKILDRMAIRGW